MVSSALCFSYVAAQQVPIFMYITNTDVHIGSLDVHMIHMGSLNMILQVVRYMYLLQTGTTKLALHTVSQEYPTPYSITPISSDGHVCILSPGFVPCIYNNYNSVCKSSKVMCIVLQITPCARA